MTITELISVLARQKAKHGDLEVIVTWETTTHDIGPENIYLSHCYRDEIEERVLIIDADENSYKEALEVKS
jgi:hypothetical protein